MSPFTEPLPRYGMLRADTLCTVKRGADRETERSKSVWCARRPGISEETVQRNFTQMDISVVLLTLFLVTKPGRCLMGEMQLTLSSYGKDLCRRIRFL